METPKTSLLTGFYCRLLFILFAQTVLGQVHAQDLASMDNGPMSLSSFYEVNLPNYPECPDPIGVVCYTSADAETIYFKGKIDPNRFHYEIKFSYQSDPDRTTIVQVKSGSFYEIDNELYGIPDVIEIRRICHELGTPFVYESKWIQVPKVQNSRTSGDSICDQFNGADLEYDPDNHIFNYSCLFDIRGSFTNVRVLLEVDYCTAHDSSVYIYSFPFAYSAGSNKVCAMTMTLQYQTPNGQWHQCDEIVVYESIDNFVSTSCDGNHSEVEIEDSTLLTSLVGVDVIYVGGFAVRIVSLVSGHPLSGNGIMTLPFQDKPLVVEFSNLDVNTDHQVVNVDNGSYIAAISTGSPSIPFSNLSTEEERCVKPQHNSEWNSDGTNEETGELWDPNGFCQNGQYCKEPPYPGYEAGDPFDPDYDPCGFDANGIHRETGTKFNPAHCSRDSLTDDTPQQHCVLDCIPYYWLQSPEVTDAGLAFYDSIRTELIPTVDSLLDVIENEISSQLSIKESECADLVSDMRDVVSTNHIDSISIFGENSQYIRPGLADRFVRKPEPFKVHMERSGFIVNLENLHIQLYECDVEHSKLEDQLEIIQGIIEDTTGLMAYLALRIKSFTQTEINGINTHAEWMTRLKSLIYQYIEKEYNENHGIGFNLKESEFKGHLFEMPDGRIDANDREEGLHYISNAFIGTVDLIDEHLGEASLGGPPTGNVLPLDINVDILGETYTITITRIGFYPEYLTLDAFIRMDVPFSAEQVVFSCHDVQFSPHGLFEAGKLELADTVAIKLFNVANLILNPEHSFVEWDCSGFKELSLDGFIEFCRNTLTPLDSITNEPLTDGDKKVRAFFQTDITSFSGFFTQLTVEPFIVTGYPFVRFTIDSAFLDMSTSVSPEVTMPLGYTNENCTVIGTNQTVPTPFWQGFYLGHMRATIASGVANTHVDIHHGIIDDRGFSAFARISQTTTALDTGNIGKWPFGIDAIRLHFLFNNLIGGGFEGQINVPIFRNAECSTSGEIDSTDCFRYTADYVNGGVQFSVSPKSHMCAPLWKAKIDLDSNTIITIKDIQGEFTVEAKLCGYATIDTIGFLHVDTARFENVILRNRAPYFSPGNWLVTDAGLDLGGFGISLHNVTLDTLPGEGDKARLNFIAGIEVNADFNVSAEGGFSAIGRLVETNNRQKWIFNNFSVNTLSINADIKGTQILGFLKYFDTNNTYGNGFKAAVKVKFARLKDQPGEKPKNKEEEEQDGSLTIAAAGIFGKKDGFHYFNVDALAQFNPSIPIGALTIRALGGGISYRMGAQDSLLALPVNMNIPTDSASVFSMALGNSLTGAIYEPNELKGIGIKLILAGGISNEKICSYNAVFQVLFSSSGSIAYAGLKGTVRVMDSLDLFALPEFPGVVNKIITETDLKNWNAPSIPASIKGYFALAYTEPTQDRTGVLQGNFALYMNAGEENNPFIYGEALAEVYIGNGEWYFNLGRLKNDPKGRARLTIDLEIVRAEIRSYLNIGTGIPPMPDPPKPIMDLFGNISSPDAALGWGTGFAFGVGADVGFDIDLIIGKIEVEAGFGFDLAIKRYESAQCANTGSQIGINGWYATGQAYLYLNGSVKLLGAELVDISTGVLVQAGFPNPTWVSGRMKLKYKLLFVKGNISAKINFGQQCIPEGEEGSELPAVIYSVTPMSGSTGVDVLTSIQVDFNLPMNQTIEFTSGEDHVTYTTRIDSVGLQSASGFPIPMAEELEDENQFATYTPDYTLPPNDSFTFVIRVKVFKENVELTDLDGLERIVGFRTGSATATIPLRNIEATYPIHGMNNFYRNEYDESIGYVQLKRNQYELMPENSDESLAIVVSSATEHWIGKAAYSSNTKTITFDLPPSSLQQGEIYQAELVKTKNTEELVSQELISLNNEEYSGMKNMWKAVFRVSTYETLFDKVEELKTNMDLTESLDLEEFYESCLSLPISIDEPFDEKEILPVTSYTQSKLSNSNTLIRLGIDINELKTKSDYATEWDWLNTLLQDFADPITNYLAAKYDQEEDRYSGINSSVYVGSGCGFLNENLQSSLEFSDYENLSGYAVMEGVLEPAQMEDVETIEGEEVDPYDGSIAEVQNIVISTPQVLGRIVNGGPSFATLLIHLAVTDCLKNQGGGRSSRDTDQPCSPGSLVPPELINLAGNQLGYPDPGYEILLPVIMTYTLPGTNRTTSIHHFIINYTIN